MFIHQDPHSYPYTSIPSSIAAETRWYEIIKYQSYFHNIPISSRRIMYEPATRRSATLMDTRAHILRVMRAGYPAHCERSTSNLISKLSLWLPRQLYIAKVRAATAVSHGPWQQQQQQRQHPSSDLYSAATAATTTTTTSHQPPLLPYNLYIASTIYSIEPGLLLLLLLLLCRALCTVRTFASSSSAELCASSYSCCVAAAAAAVYALTCALSTLCERLRKLFPSPSSSSAILRERTSERRLQV
ncbi:unnamed protein product, partial [Trichogramma brassicae]